MATGKELKVLEQVLGEHVDAGGGNWERIESSLPSPLPTRGGVATGKELKAELEKGVSFSAADLLRLMKVATGKELKETGTCSGCRSARSPSNRSWQLGKN